MEYGKLKILLVDDDEDDAELILHSLRKFNDLKLMHIDDGVDAMRYLLEDRGDKPDLILLDLKMPKVDGIQILRKMKSDPSRKYIPIVALISSKEGQKYVESHGLCADAYLMKPVESKTFQDIRSSLGFSDSLLQSPSYT
jgi:two-component system, response regulator